MQNDFDMFKYALTKLQIGQVIRLSGTNQFGGTHSQETFIVKSVDENEILTTTGLIFHHSKLTRLSFTEQVTPQHELPFLNLTGVLENFPSEPE